MGALASRRGAGEVDRAGGAGGAMVPPGWSYNPSTWAQRLPIVGLAAPAALGYGGAAATNDRIVGPLVASFAFVAVWEITRSLRWINLALGAWLLVAPWALGYDRPALLSSLVVGVLLIGLAGVRGRIEARFGGGWPSLFS